MLVGDEIISKRPSYGGVTPKDDDDKEYKGTVIYIHPQRRFFTVEWQFPHFFDIRVIRESFTFRNYEY